MHTIADVDGRTGREATSSDSNRRQTERPVPRWANVIAHVIPLLTLASGLWRIPVAFGHSMGMIDENGQPVQLGGWGQTVAIIGISIFAEAVALTAFGLVRTWGEVVPRWIPFIGGRRVPPLGAVIPAVLGSLALIYIWTYGFRDVFFGFDDFPLRFAGDGWAALMITCYAPLNLWGPLLLVLTWAYYRRRVPRRQGRRQEPTTFLHKQRYKRSRASPIVRPYVAKSVHFGHIMAAKCRDR